MEYSSFLEAITSNQKELDRKSLASLPLDIQLFIRTFFDPLSIEDLRAFSYFFVMWRLLVASYTPRGRYDLKRKWTIVWTIQKLQPYVPKYNFADKTIQSADQFNHPPAKDQYPKRKKRSKRKQNSKIVRIAKFHDHCNECSEPLSACVCKDLELYCAVCGLYENPYDVHMCEYQDYDDVYDEIDKCFCTSSEICRYCRHPLDRSDSSDAGISENAGNYDAGYGHGSYGWGYDQDGCLSTKPIDRDDGYLSSVSSDSSDSCNCSDCID